jgi:hypothetical protein
MGGNLNYKEVEAPFLFLFFKDVEAHARIIMFYYIRI